MGRQQKLMLETEPVVLVDVRREVNQIPRPFHEYTPAPTVRYQKPEEFLTADLGQLRDCRVAVIRCGDGFFGAVENKLIKTKGGNLEDIVILWQEGGTTMCTLKGARRGERIAIPSHLASLIPGEHYQANKYFPPIIEFYGDLEQEKPDDYEYYGYLGGFDQLTVAGVKFETALAKRGILDLKKRYEQAGMKTVGTIFQRIEPEYIAYSQDGQIFPLKGPCYAAAFVISVPYFAAFSINRKIPNDKILLVVIRERNNILLAAKFINILLFFKLFKNGINFVLDKSWAEPILADSVIVYPDQRAFSKDQENSNIDGQLRCVGRYSKIRRSPKPLTIISPNQDIYPLPVR